MKKYIIQACIAYQLFIASSILIVYGFRLNKNVHKRHRNRLAEVNEYGPLDDLFNSIQNSDLF